MVKQRMDLLELLRKRGMDGDVDLLREALRVLVDGIMTGGPENLSVQGAGREPLVDHVRKVSGRYDWVIVDGPPGISNISADAVRVADVVLIPAKASAFDCGPPPTSWRPSRPASSRATVCPEPPS